ncbi:MAG: ABC transporter ATP-binding protein [Myxococcales bacterium]|nr:ABC transporter ATP-binding protein [Myxococcales bacterium]
MIETHKLTRRYGARVAVEALSFTVERGQIVGFLGPNGAGKSSTLRMLSGFIPPTAGTARIAGFDIVEEKQSAQAMLGYMPETMPLYPELRVREYLRFRGEIKGLWGKKLNAAVDRAMGLADIADRDAQLIGELSKGYKQRVGLADALVASPPLLILDEPTEGLDPNQVARFRQLLGALKAEHTILLSTHILSEVEAVCDHVVILHQGKLVAAGSLDEVTARRGAGAFAVRCRAPEGPWQTAPEAEARRCFEGLGLEVEGASAEAGLVSLKLSLTDGDEAALEAAVARLVGAGLGVREVKRATRELEEVFQLLTAEGGAA